MLILNDKEYFNYLMENGFEKNVNSKDLVFLARMFYDEDNNEKKVLNRIVDFCKKWSKDFNYSKWENKIYEILKIVKEKNIKVNEEEICFYKYELDKIKEIEDYKIQKVLFIMLCILKKFNQNYIYLNSTSYIKLKDIFYLAKIDIPQKEQNLFLNKMYNIGLLEVDLKPLLRCKVSFYDKENCENQDYYNYYNEENKILSFIPNNDMILEYEKHLDSKKTINCQICGKTITKTNNKVKYCKDCARKMKIKMTIQSQK